MPSATQEARQLNNSLLIRLQQRIEAKSLLTHPFYQAWQAGQLSIQDLRTYASQYYFFEADFPSFLSAIHSQCPSREVRQSILDNLWDEEHGDANHRAMWLDFCAGLGLERDKVELSSIHPKTQALLDTYFRLCQQGSFQEGLAAVYAYEAQVPQVSLEKIEGLKVYYGITNAASLKFFEVHSILDEDHSRKEAEGIASHTARQDEPAVEVSLQAALDSWWGFLDGVEEQRRALNGAPN
jgi:pyrroloquinoline-quinone synthase